MSKKKIFLLVFLVIVIAIAIVMVKFLTENKERNKLETANINNVTSTTDDIEVVKKPTTITELEDGIEYSVIGGKRVVPEIVIGDDGFDSRLSDIISNFDNYNGKVIEIEGFHLKTENISFIARYSTSTLCEHCLEGYSYFEYEWNGDKDLELEPEKDWIKIVGVLKKAIDSLEYYYIDVLSLKVKMKGEI